MFKVASFCMLCSKWPVSVSCVQSDQFLRAVFKLASFCVLCSKWPVSACCVQSGQFLRAVFKVASFCVLALRDFCFVVSGCCVGESHPPSPELSDTILVMYQSMVSSIMRFKHNSRVYFFTCHFIHHKLFTFIKNILAFQN